MPDTKVIRPVPANVVSAFYVRSGDVPQSIVTPENTTAGDDIIISQQTRMHGIVFSSAELASLEIYSRQVPDPVFEGDDDL